MSYKDKLVDLAKQVKTHPALNNQFFEAWTSRRLSEKELKIFARNYGEWVKSFPVLLAILFTNLDDLIAQTELASTLFSEIGYGDPEKVHWVLLDNFLTKLARKMSKANMLNREALNDELDLLPSTQALITGERQLYSHSDKARAVGAQLALEHQAYTMLREGQDGAENYADLWEDRDEFCETLEYYYVHTGAAEKKHKVESLNMALQYAKNEPSFQSVVKGLNEHFELLAVFWTGICSAW